MSKGVYVLGGKCPGGKCPGVSVRGIDVLGVDVLGVSVLGVSVRGVSVRGVDVLGVSVRGVHVRGGYVLEPCRRIKSIDSFKIEQIVALPTKVVSLKTRNHSSTARLYLSWPLPTKKDPTVD